MEWFTFILVAFFSIFRSATAMDCSWITVDLAGEGDFATIQAAINSVPSNNPAWICIYIKAGVYKEKVLIPQDKPFIYLQGEGEGNTNVVWDAHGSIATSATFTAQADYLVARKIAFTNSYNYPLGSSSGKEIEKAVAVLLQGDKLAFYECGIYGVQDTLWDSQGRHYFQFCTIEGAVDFIFGSGQSIYEKCTISVSAPGFITAQGRSTADEPNGFVFKDCVITGDGNEDGKAYLGRPWRPYARVIFYNTRMDGTIAPSGWFAWKSTGQESKLSFDEIKCDGSGADTTERVSWVNKQSFSELQKFIDISYIDGSSWIVPP